MVVAESCLVHTHPYSYPYDLFHLPPPKDKIGHPDTRLDIKLVFLPPRNHVRSTPFSSSNPPITRLGAAGGREESDEFVLYDTGQRTWR